jgi:membrane-associated phospholipid phosphatase
MEKIFLLLIAILLTANSLVAQTEPGAGNWKTWFIRSGKDYRLPKPSLNNEENKQVLAAQKALDSAGMQQIIYWNAGAPNYRWQELMNKLWMTDTGRNGALANLLLGTAIYDAMIAAWDTKYAYQTPRPFATDKRIKVLVVKPQSPSYPCEYSVAAGAAVTLISHFYPHLTDSVLNMARRLMASRVAAGVAFPSDTKAGFALGKRVAEMEIDFTKDYIYKTAWDGKMPERPGIWRGKQPMAPTAGRNKTVILDSASQFRPGPPPDFAQEMAALNNYKQTFSSQANAFYWARQDYWSEALVRKIFEHNLHLNPPRAARIYAAVNLAAYDGFIACFDAKYAYWGIRPNQYDTTYQSLVPTPPFPGYPSGHAVMSGMFSALYAWFFPEENNNFQKKAKDAAESRFQAGIHFRSDNEAGLLLGKRVAAAVIQKLSADGADADRFASQKEAAKPFRTSTAKANNFR